MRSRPRGVMAEGTVGIVGVVCSRRWGRLCDVEAENIRKVNYFKISVSPLLWHMKIHSSCFTSQQIKLKFGTLSVAFFLSLTHRKNILSWVHMIPVLIRQRLRVQLRWRKARTEKRYHAVSGPRRES